MINGKITTTDREEIEQLIETLEANGWDVVEYHVKADAPVTVDQLGVELEAYRRPRER